MSAKWSGSGLFLVSIVHGNCGVTGKFEEDVKPARNNIMLFVKLIEVDKFDLFKHW